MFCGHQLHAKRQTMLVRGIAWFANCAAYVALRIEFRSNSVRLGGDKELQP
jgi:hypothetical protein